MLIILDSSQFMKFMFDSTGKFAHNFLKFLSFRTLEGTGGFGQSIFKYFMQFFCKIDLMPL